MHVSHLRSNPARLIATPALAMLFLAAILSVPAAAQVPDTFKPFNLSGKPEQTEPVVRASGQIQPGVDGKPGVISITAEMDPGWHIYSITQAPNGPKTTELKIPPSADYKIGPFKAVEEPHVAPEPAFNNLPVESHEDSVTWKATIDISPGVDLAKLAIKGAVFAQACEKVCLLPQDYEFTAKVAGAAPVAATTTSNAPPNPSTSTIPSAGPPLPTSFAPPSPTGVFMQPPNPNAGGLPGVLGAFSTPLTPPVTPEKFTSESGHLTLTGSIQPIPKHAIITLRAEPAPEWHVYVTEGKLPRLGNQPTLIIFTETAGFRIGPPLTTDQPVAVHNPSELPYFEKPVTWTSDIEIPPGTKPGDYRIAGAIGFQTCKSESQCDLPKAVKFEATLTIDADGAARGSAVRFTESEHYGTLSKIVIASRAKSTDANLTATGPAIGTLPVDPLANLQVQSNTVVRSLPYYLMLAFFAGFILNFMPCVLPVIGLKVLSFVEQSGHDRKKILTLNIWYSLGMISVFWVLAALAIVLKTGWGEQFSYDGFTIPLISIVFVMSLSFLGVWEIPIPGFAGGSGAQKLANKEGNSGAFAKGVITTVLATPCSGPGLATALGFAVTQPPPVTIAVFTAMGLGMASPYLAIGINPAMLRFLPKPGEWMDTFKQVMGFVLLGTVVYLLTTIPVARLVPTIALMFALWAGCWWIGRTPVYAELPQKLRAWAGATAWSVAIGWFAFSWLQDVANNKLERFVVAEIIKRSADAADPSTQPQPKAGDAATLDWRHFTIPQLQTALADKQTVLIDFTADWCPTCKTLKAVNLDHPATKALVDQNGVVTFEADMTSPTKEMWDFLLKLNPAKSVPVIAIFPAEDPSRPLIFGDGYTQAQILDGLKKAGPSKPKTAAAPKAALENKSAEVNPVNPNRLNWQSVTVPDLNAALKNGKTVLLSFTADWDPTSAVTQKYCLDQPETKLLVDELRVVTFAADMTDLSNENSGMHQKLCPSSSVPCVAIFAGNNPLHPVVFQGPFDKSHILAALTKAGPSKPPASEAPKLGMR